VSSNNGDWIYQFMDKNEADNMDAKMEMIEENANTVVTMVMSATKEDVIDLCKTWDKATMGDVYAWLRISSFMEHLIDNMKNHLEGEEE
jgi:dsDNA-binding SOS-regulon protein